MRILIRHIKKLVQTAENPDAVKCGKEMQQLDSIDHAFLLIDEGRIVDFGPMEKAPSEGSVHLVVDAHGRMVFPSFCDSHTHLVYAAPREEEFVDRIKGLGYEEIAAKGGGILNSARRLNETSEEALYEAAAQRLEEVMRMGTGAIEIKSGYALTVEGELKMLRVIKRLKENSPMTIKATFLGAHAIPAEYKENREGYITLLTDKLVPQVAGEGLAEYIDVFCERGYFSADELDRILEAGTGHGLKPKVHVNQFSVQGGIPVAVKHKAISVDHLEVVADADITALQGSGTICTLLPSCSFFLGLDYAPARKLMEAGLPVALATDYNPGSTPSGNIPFLLSLACIKQRMLPEEAINAVTVNGAAAMELGHELGSIARGKKANLFITKPIPSLAYIPYAFGSGLVQTVILNGEVV